MMAKVQPARLAVEDPDETKRIEKKHLQDCESVERRARKTVKED